MLKRRSNRSITPAASSCRPEISSVLSVSVNSRKPWSRSRRSAAGTSGWGGIVAEPAGEFGAGGITDRYAAGGSEHPEHGTAGAGERNVDAGQRERLRVGDQPGEPQAHGRGVAENPVKDGADRLEVEQGLVDIEDDDRSLRHWDLSFAGGQGASSRLAPRAKPGRRDPAAHRQISYPRRSRSAGPRQARPLEAMRTHEPSAACSMTMRVSSTREAMLSLRKAWRR